MNTVDACIRRKNIRDMTHANPSDELRQLLLRSLDEDLPPREAERLADALRTHAWLRREAEQYRQLRQLLPKLHPPPNAAFAQRVMARLPSRTARRVVLQQLWPAAVAAGVLALTLALGWIYSSTGGVTKEALMGLEEMNADDVYVLNDW